MAFGTPEIQLNSGSKMPVIGLGTATFSSVKADDKQAVLQAIERGYRHFDTAAHYGSEEAVGEAINRGLTRSRQELFITSKLWCSDAHAERVLPALQKTLENLKLEYLDLYLIHWPISAKPGYYEYPMKKENVLPFDCNNFTSKKIDDMLAFSRIPPAVNQVELNPCWQQKKLIDLCKAKGIVVTSFSPLGAVGTAWGSNRVVDNEVLKEIAKAKGKRVAIVVKSYKPERMQENRDIFERELNDEECKKISEIPQSRGHRGEEFVSDDGPIKSIEELWDGEL
ncbi:hypothetical protein Pfo_024120 [Paulownia fortunei]|nr:hypothetical protein Pfo_024120 [Paulownia fortunei]